MATTISEFKGPYLELNTKTMRVKYNGTYASSTPQFGLVIFKLFMVTFFSEVLRKFPRKVKVDQVYRRLHHQIQWFNLLNNKLKILVN